MGCHYPKPALMKILMSPDPEEKRAVWPALAFVGFAAWGTDAFWFHGPGFHPAVWVAAVLFQVHMLPGRERAGALILDCSLPVFSLAATCLIFTQFPVFSLFELDLFLPFFVLVFAGLALLLLPAEQAAAARPLALAYLVSGWLLAGVGSLVPVVWTQPVHLLGILFTFGPLARWLAFAVRPAPAS